MTAIVQSLQILGGVLWLIVALFVSPRIARSWRADASRATMLAAPIGFMAWMQVGFTIRWLVWPRAMGGMNGAELTAWAALYGLSAVLGAWFLAGAFQTRND